MRCSRSASAFLMVGNANFHSSAKTIRNEIAPQKISLPSGMIGFFALTSVAWSAAANSRYRTYSPLALREEEEHEAEQRQRLGERDTEEHGGAHRALHLGLSRHRGDGGTDDVADADA